jgi:hypothetical protein
MRFLRALLVMLTVSVSLLAADSPFSGTWKFNPAEGTSASAAAEEHRRTGRN